jgi:hypothetical protein
MELDGSIVNDIKTSLLDNCGGIFGPLDSRLPVTALPLSGAGGAPSPSRADVLLYATPDTDRDLFRAYAADVILKNRIDITSSQTPQGIITFGEFEALDGSLGGGDAYDQDYLNSLGIATGVIGAFVLVVHVLSR